MTRTVKLPRGGRPRPPPAPRERRPPGRGVADRVRPRPWCWPTADAATPGWPSASPSSPPTSAPSSARRPPILEEAARCTAVEPHVPRPAQLQLPAATPPVAWCRTSAPGCSASPRTGWSCSSPANSGTAIGITTGLQFLPFLLLSPVAGLVADRMPKRRLLQITNVMMAAPGADPRPARRHRRREIWHVYVLAFVLGVGAAFDAPARQSFVSRDRRPRRPDQRRRPQLRQLQRRPHRRPGARRPADRRPRRRRRPPPAG